MMNSSLEDHPEPESSMSTENDTVWLTEFHNTIQSRLTDYENYQFQWCEVRYEENKLSHRKLGELIGSLLAPYPDLATQFREIISSMQAMFIDSESNGNDQVLHKPVDFSFNVDKLSIQRQNEPSLFRLLRSNNPDYEAVRDFIASHQELAYERNEFGQLPLHVACIKGCPYIIIMALLEVNPEALTVKDNAGRLPLHHYVTIHSASSWSDSVTTHIQEYSQDKYITDLSVDVINLLGAKHLILQKDDFGFCPLTCLSLECHFMDSSNKKKVENAKQILDTMINFDPPFSIYLFKSIRTFPSRFVKRAANNKYIKEKLNHAASSSFLFFASIILDLMMRLTIIYAYTNIPSLRRRFKGETTDDPYNFSLLYIGIGYLLSKLIVRLWAFKEVGNTVDWTKSGWNWLQLLEFGLVSFSTISLHTAPKIDHSVSTTLATGIQWLSLLIVMRPASRHFVRFWSGILNVMNTLFPFFITTCIFILGFVYMLHFSYKYSDCKGDGLCELTVTQIIYRIILDAINGQIENDQQANTFVTSLTFIYGIFVLLLLLNILIAVVIDAYGETNGDKTFWYERLIYVSEIEIVFPCRNRRDDRHFYKNSKRQLEYNWETFLQFLFEPKKFNLHTAKNRGYKLEKTNYTRIKDGICRFLGLIIGLPLWLLVGFLTLGWLLPLQVKRYLLDGQIEEEVEEEDSQGKIDLETLQESIVKQVKHLEKRQNKKFLKLQSELEILRSKEDRLKVVEKSLNKLDLILECLKKDS